MERTGALLVAWTPEQAAALPAIEENARRNGYLAIRPLRAEELYAREPQLGPGALGALEIPDESIICPWTTPLAFATEAAGAGVRLLLSARVTGVAAGGDGFYQLATTRGPLRCRWVVNAAGLASDEVDRMFGGGGFTIRPRRGELIVFDKLARHADPLDPAAGADRADQGGAGRAHGLRERAARSRPPRTLPTAATPPRPPPGSARCSRPGGGSCPGWPSEEVTSTYAGLRAATEHPDYQIRVDAERRYACAGGIRSTGLSASLGHRGARRRAAGRGRTGAAAARLARPVPVMPYIGEAGVRPYQDAERIAADPAYGQIVCHCERVTRGEIRDAWPARCRPPTSADCAEGPGP